MNDTTGKTLIGAFILGGLALATAAVIVFGSGRFSATARSYTLYFDGSVQGLNTGSPVVFKGVKVGQVKDIRLHADMSDFTFRIPVIVDIEPERMVVDNVPDDQDSILDKLVLHGLRGQLLPQSLITGQYMIQLDLMPDTEARFVADNPPFPEIPTVPSPLDRLSKTVQELPLAEVVERFRSTVEGVERIVNSEQTSRTLASLSDILDKANRRLDPMADSTEQTLAEIRETARCINGAVPPLLDEARRTVAGYAHLAPSLERLAKRLETTLDETSRAMGQGRSTLRAMEGQLGQDAPLMVELRRTLGEIAAMSRSIRQLAEFLRRHPESMLRGKDAPGGK